MKGWEAVIGLEVHTQLSTRSKLFSGAATRYGAPPNTQACAVDIALPGVLPVMNAAAAYMAVKFGLAINAAIARRSVFARKNYFYPDLPKGYQISQYELPIVHHGYLDIEIDSTRKRIGIARAHLEEDAGKSLHEDFRGRSGIDLNRAGTPLLEIVSEPDLRSAREAVAYLKKLHMLVRYLGICDGNMQEGSFRCDANVSVRRRGDPALGTRTELKNINSFRFVERAIDFEIERQIELIEGGGRVVQETRLYDPERDETRSLRGKEEAHDYRYFPDPDLPPLVLDEAFIEEVRRTLPELPDAKAARLRTQYGLGEEDVRLFVESPATADYFEATLALTQAQPRVVANWINVEMAAYLNREDRDITAARIPPPALARLLDRVTDGTISGKIAKEVFAAMWAGEGEADTIIEKRGLRQVCDSAAIEKVVGEILGRHPAQVQQYRAGQQKVFGFFVGQIMKAMQGKANPQQVNEILRKKLEG